MPGPRTFRKRPMEVQALQWTGDNVRKMQLFADTNFEVLNEPDDRDPDATASVFDHLHKTWILVHTSDWVVCDIQRAFHPVRRRVPGDLRDRRPMSHLHRGGTGYGPSREQGST
jgi:hypothetical protein